MKKFISIIFLAVIFPALILTSCDNQKAGTFAVKFSWAKDDAGKEVKPDVSTGEFFVTVRIYEWKEGVTFPGDIAANGKQLTQSEPAQMKATGTSIDFGDLSYGSRRFVVAEIRKGEELTNSVLFTGMSKLFELKAGKHTEVNVEMKLTPTPGVDEEGNRIDAELRIVDDNGNLRSYTSGNDLKVKLRLLNAVSFTHVYFANKEENLKTANGKSYKIGELKEIKDVDNGYELDGEWDLSFGLTTDEIAVLPELKVYARLENEYGTGLLVMAKIALDNQSPELTLGLNPAYTNGSKTITLNISANELIKHDSLNIQTTNDKLVFDCPAPTKNESLSFTCTIETLDATLKDGDFTITVSAADQAGNKSEETKTTLTIDRESPELTFVAYKNGTEVDDTIYLKENDEFKVDLTLSKEPAETPVVRLGSAGINCEKTADLKYSCVAEIKKETFTEGISDLSVTYHDMAENQFSKIVISGIRLDYTVPVITIDINKNAFNSNDTIRITVTSSEELNGQPVVKIPELSMTLTSPAQISIFSWVYSVDPSSLNDFDYTVTAEGVDIVGLKGISSGYFSVDSSIPGLVSSSIDRTKAGLNKTYTIDFEITEPVTGGIPVVKANDIVLTNCVQNGSDKIFKCSRTVGAEETDSTVYAVIATLTDEAGNSRAVTLGSVMIDKTFPDAAGTAVLSIDAGSDCTLTQEQVTTLADGSTAYLTVQVSEKLAAGYTPVLTAKKTGALDIIFDLDTSNGLTYYFSYAFNEPTPTQEMIGEYTLELALKDEAGNEKTVVVTPDKPFQTTWSDPVLIVDQEVVTYTRSPWGRSKQYEIKDDKENVVYTIPANDYYEIGTSDLYAKTDRLPASAFTLDYGVATGAPAQLMAWDRDGNYLALAKNKPNGDGSWPRTRIYSYDSSEVFISAIDSSCRETEKVKILNVNWVASMNKKQASKPTANPHEYKTTRFFDARLGQAQRFLTEPEVYNPTDGLLTINTPTVFTATDYAWEQRSTGGTGKGLVYNEAREKLESAPWVREWNGANWTNLSNSPSTRDYSAFAYDIVRERVVQFGGGSDLMAMVGDMAYDDFYEMDVDGTWYSMTPATKPPARIGHGMAYDPARNKTVLFGGAFATINPSTHQFEGSVTYRDTWEWDGTNWTQRTGTTCTGDDCYVCEATTCPPFVYIMDPNSMGGGGGLQARHAMVYDERREKILLVVRDKTWVWDGVVWSERPASLSGNGNSFPTMTYDRLSGKILLFRKHKWSSPSETWEWDGSAWTQITPVVNAPADYYGVPSLAYDPVYEESILIGSGTWAWRGTGHDLPAQIFTVAMDHSKISEYTGVTFRSVTANFDTGGIGDVAGAATDGATLLFWHDDEWYDIATNEAGIAESLPLQKSVLNSETDLQTLLDANGNSISFAVTPTAPRGFGTVTGEVATDYAEVVVRYTIE